MHDEEVLGKAYDARLMRRLISYLRPYRKQVLFALVLLVFEAAWKLFPAAHHDRHRSIHRRRETPAGLRSSRASMCWRWQ